MKKFNITVNGQAYEVEVEEVGGAVSAAPAPKAAAPVAAPAPKAATRTAPKAAPKAAKKAAPAGAQGAVKVNAPMPGKILKVNVNAGAAVKKGDVLLVLEAMKMENEICAPQDGTVATVECAAGDSVESGKVLVSMN